MSSSRKLNSSSGSRWAGLGVALSEASMVLKSHDTLVTWPSQPMASTPAVSGGGSNWSESVCGCWRHITARCLSSGWTHDVLTRIASCCSPKVLTTTTQASPWSVFFFDGVEFATLATTDDNNNLILLICFCPSTTRREVASKVKFFQLERQDLTHDNAKWIFSNLWIAVRQALTLTPGEASLHFYPLTFIGNLSWVKNSWHLVWM